METHDPNERDPQIPADSVISSPPVMTEMPARLHELRQMVDAMEEDFLKFYVHGNKAAGTRVRAAMQQLKTFAQAVRAEVQEIKNDGKPAATKSSDLPPS
jgi:hypothetical protein